MESGETVNTEASFEQHLLPILTAKCFAGCHVAGGPKNLDCTYQVFIKGGDEGAVFVPGNAQGSSISGRMPLGGDRLMRKFSISEIGLIIKQHLLIHLLMNHLSHKLRHSRYSPLNNTFYLSLQQDDANGPDNLDFRTYETFIRGGEDGAVFRPGNARSSDIIEEIVGKCT